MVVDYSKWDKLELSDDSDIEVHPNVDKASFIRWKQRDIHEKRAQAKFRIDQLKVNIETNGDLLTRIDKLIAAVKSGKPVSDVKTAVAISSEGETKTKPALATSPEQPLYDDMIESMYGQVLSECKTPDQVLAKLEEHRGMITGAVKDETAELKKLEEEKKLHISSEDLHDGWNSTIVWDNKKSDEPKSEPKLTSSTGSLGKKETKITTLNSPSKAQTEPKVDDNGLEELLPATIEFSKIEIGNSESAFTFLSKHPYILREGQKDALLMTAFDAFFKNDPVQARRIIYNSTILQYCELLNRRGSDGVRKFFSQIADKKSPVREGLEKEVESTFNHIQGRCKVLSSEQEEDQEGEEQIQLHAVDPNTTIEVSVPKEGTEGRKIYDEFPANVKEAVSSGSLEEINKLLASLSVEEAEDLVNKFSSSGVLSVEEKIYDMKDFQEIKDQHNLAAQTEEADADDEEEPASSTIDELD